MYLNQNQVCPMNKIITVNTSPRAFGDKKIEAVTIYINVDSICYFTSESTGSIIYLSDGSCLHLTDTPKQIISEILSEE